MIRIRNATFNQNRRGAHQNKENNINTLQTSSTDQQIHKRSIKRS